MLSSKMMKSVGLDVDAISKVRFPMTNSHDPKLLPLIVMIEGDDDCNEVGWILITTGSGCLAKTSVDSTMDPAISSEMRQSPAMPCENEHITEERFKEPATPRVPSPKKHHVGEKVPKPDPLKVTTPPDANIVDGNTDSILEIVDT
jgi:hypothetical protein